jgi:hypothetical protein
LLEVGDPLVDALVEAAGALDVIGAAALEETALEPPALDAATVEVAGVDAAVLDGDAGG